jgi:hypothetical protein
VKFLKETFTWMANITYEFLLLFTLMVILAGAAGNG